jgi:hypothetical protein
MGSIGEQEMLITKYIKEGPSVPVSFSEFDGITSGGCDSSELTEAIGILQDLQAKTTALASLKEMETDEVGVAISSILNKYELEYVLTVSGVSMENNIGDAAVDIVTKAIVGLAKLFVTVAKTVLRLFFDYLDNLFSAATRVRNASEDLLKRVNRLKGEPQHPTILLDKKHYPVIDTDGNLDIDLFTVGIQEQLDELKQIVIKERIKDKKTNKKRIKGILGGDSDYAGSRTDAWGLTMVKDSAYQLTKDTIAALDFKKYTVPFLESKSRDLEYKILNSKAETEQEANEEYALAQRDINVTIDVIKNALRSFVTQNQARLSVIALMASNIK